MCGYNKNPKTFRHSALPKGQNLTGEGLRSDLEKIFETLAGNAEKIAPCASTNVVESFNKMITSKAPKIRHYAASGSLRDRVSCAVAQKNIGHGYVTKVNESLGLSPGKDAKKNAQTADKKRVSERELK